MKRGYVRASPRVREKPQIETLTEYGVSREAIYVQSDDEDVTTFIRSLRDGDEACVTTLDRLAKRRSDMQSYMREIEARKAVLVEVKTGRRAATVSEVRDIIFDAMNVLSRDGIAQRPDVGRMNGLLGGRPTKPRMRDGEALEIWRDPRITVHDALAKMEGWTMRSAYRVLGPRLVGGGRPAVRKDKRNDLMPPETKIYFIQAGKTVKIGLSDNVKIRLKRIQTSTPHRLKVVGAVEGGFAEEKALHRRFAQYHIRREWFKFSDEIKEYLADMPPLDD